MNPGLTFPVTSFPNAGPRALVSARVRQAVDAHYDALWRFLRRLGVFAPDVEDAAQQVLLVFAQRASTLDPSADRAFLFGTAVRVASDARKKRARSREVAGDDAVIASRPDPWPNAEEQLAERQRRRWLDNVLDTLSDDHRAVFVLVELEEQTMADAALALGIPAGTVASRLRRARESFEASALALKTRLESEGALR